MKIAITGDILRPDKNGKFSQEYNIDWFSKLIPLKADIINYKEFDTLKFYQSLNKDFNIKNWCELYNNNDIHIKYNLFYNYDVVIGFELPNIIKNALSKDKKTYIDFVVSPIRFLDSDVYLTCSSNNMDILNRLELLYMKQQINFVNAIKFEVIKYKETPQFLNGNVGLIVGQTDFDRSLITDNGFFDLKEKIINELPYLKKEHDIILYKPHPYQPDEIIGIETTDKNIYELLSQNAITTVYGYNSSSLYEAMQFKKKVVKWDNKEFYQDYYTFPHDYTNNYFWDYILFNKLTSYQPAQKEQNFLRNIVGKWGKQ